MESEFESSFMNAHGFKERPLPLFYSISTFNVSSSSCSVAWTIDYILDKPRDFAIGNYSAGTTGGDIVFKGNTVADYSISVTDYKRYLQNTYSR